MSNYDYDDSVEDYSTTSDTNDGDYDSNIGENAVFEASLTDTLPESEFEAVVENSPNVSSEIENSSSIETPTGEAISANGRTPIESEKKTEEMLDNENKDYTHQTILDENLHTLSRREAGSIAPDHMAAYDNEGNVIKSDDYSSVAHFDIVEDKNYGIEKDYGRNNLIQNICDQAENRNTILGVNGATIHQTYRIDVSGHEDISLEQLENLYEKLNSKLPDNVDVEFVLD